MWDNWEARDPINRKGLHYYFCYVIKYVRVWFDTLSVFRTWSNFTEVNYAVVATKQWKNKNMNIIETVFCIEILDYYSYDNIFVDYLFVFLIWNKYLRFSGLSSLKDLNFHQAILQNNCLFI